MNIKSLEVCIAVTALAIGGFFIHGVYGFISLLGHANSFIEVMSIIFMIFNIIAFSSFRGIADIRGIYQGKKRYLSVRRVITYALWTISTVSLILYLNNEIGNTVVIATMNLAMAFTIMNAYGFGKTRGKFYWCKYI